MDLLGKSMIFFKKNKTYKRMRSSRTYTKIYEYRAHFIL